jgi:hypothetical protein
MSLSQEQRIFAQDVKRLLDYIYDMDYSVSFGEAYRTQEQAEWYEQKGLGIADSQHCKRLAIDLNIFDKKGSLLNKASDYTKFGCFWENLDAANRWGGRFNGKFGPSCDAQHFERHAD